MVRTDRLWCRRSPEGREFEAGLRYLTTGCCIVVVLLFHVHGKHRSKVMSGRSVNLTTLFLGRLRPPKQLTNFVHILSPVTDNCPS